jgi:hypothetical protein
MVGGNASISAKIALRLKDLTLDHSVGLLGIGIIEIGIPGDEHLAGHRKVEVRFEA